MLATETETETRDRRTGPLVGLEVLTSVGGGALTHSSPGCTSLPCLNSQNFPAAEQLRPEKERQVWKHDLGSFLGFLCGANFSTDKGFQTFYPDSADLYLLFFTAWKCSLPALSHESRREIFQEFEVPLQTGSLPADYTVQYTLRCLALFHVSHFRFLYRCSWTQ